MRGLGAGRFARFPPVIGEVVDAKLRSERLKGALEQLTAEQRAVLSLFAVDGLGHREIAEVLGVPVGTVWSRLCLARKKLAATLADPPGEDASGGRD